MQAGRADHDHSPPRRSRLLPGALGGVRKGLAAPAGGGPWGGYSGGTGCSFSISTIPTDLDRQLTTVNGWGLANQDYMIGLFSGDLYGPVLHLN